MTKQEIINTITTTKNYMDHYESGIDDNPDSSYNSPLVDIHVVNVVFRNKQGEAIIKEIRFYRHYDADGNITDDYSFLEGYHPAKNYLEDEAFPTDS